MDWLDELKNAASGAWGDVMATGGEYVTGVWDEKRNDFLGLNDKSAEMESAKVKAAIPGAQDSRVAGSGVTAQPKRPINWQAIGVMVALAALVLK